MSDKSKAKALKFGIVGLLCGICIVAVIGITVTLNKGKEEPTVTDAQLETQQEIVVEDVEPIVIDFGTSDEDVPVMNENEQQLQEVPEIPVAPTEAPELAPDTDLTNPDEVPEYVPTEVEPVPGTTPIAEPQVPVDDGSHQGQIYVQGFGWIDYEGPSQAIPAPDLYPNGNIVGDM